VIATALLLIVILSLLETRSINAPSAWFFPLTVGAFVGMLVFVTAPLTMTSLNAARNLGPRIMALFMGFGKVAFPGPRNGLSLMITVVGPCVGAVLGALFFDRVIRPFYPLPEQPKAPSRSLASWPRGGPARRSCGGLPRPRPRCPCGWRTGCYWPRWLAWPSTVRRCSLGDFGDSARRKRALSTR